MSDIHNQREIENLQAEIKRLRAENERLRAALWDINATCNSWLYFMPVRVVKRIIRATLEGRP